MSRSGFPWPFSRRFHSQPVGSHPHCHSQTMNLGIDLDKYFGVYSYAGWGIELPRCPHPGNLVWQWNIRFMESLKMNMTTSHRVPGQSTASHPLLYGHLPHSLLGLLEPFPGSEGVRLLQGPLLCLPSSLGPSHYVNITMFEEGFLQFYYNMIDQEFLKIPCNLTSLENFLP